MLASFGHFLCTLFTFIFYIVSNIDLWSIFGPTWSQLGSNLALKIDQNSIKIRHKIYIFLNIDFRHIFHQILDLCWRRRRPKKLEKQIVFKGFCKFRFMLFDIVLDTIWSSNLLHFWSQVGAKLDQKLIRKSIRKYDGFWNWFLIDFGPSWLQFWSQLGSILDQNRCTFRQQFADSSQDV